MRKSSIHIKPVKSNSETHNNRLIEYDYVRKDLTDLNFNYQEQSIKERSKLIHKRKKTLTGRKLQKNATPIREGVVNLEMTHNSSDVARLCEGIKKEFGIRAFQIHIHKDEGHYDNDENWVPNPHAHILFDWTDEETGKMIRLKTHHMSRMQTLVAEVLRMERGQSSDREHLDAIQYKNQQERKKLKQLKLQLDKMNKVIQSYEQNGKKIEDLEVKDFFGLNKNKTIENFKENLQVAFTELDRREQRLKKMEQEKGAKEKRVQELESTVSRLKKDIQTLLYKVPLENIKKKREQLLKEIKKREIRKDNHQNQKRNRNNRRGR